MTPQVILGRPTGRSSCFLNPVFPRFLFQSIVESDFNTPHMIMTYTGVLGLAILRDDFSRLDRGDLVKFIRACQGPDGSFSSVPRNGETDLRALYCAFALSFMLDDWSGINIERAITYITSCRTYEGGYGQSPNCEAQGGTTYLAVASLYLIPGNGEHLTKEERSATIQWLLRNQEESGGFCGRTGKDADACYCFWCGAALKILGASAFLDKQRLARFLDQCQFKYGGISKAPGEHPDPYHTYLSLAAISLYPPDVSDEKIAASWRLSPLDPYINATVETAEWAKQHLPSKRLGNEERAST